MTGKLAPHGKSHGQTITGVLKSWAMVLLTLLFIAVYGAALGWLKPPADERMAERIEPIIFVIIGYYFGRLPSQQNEQTLKEEINRQTQRTDAAQQSTNQAQTSGEALEEKLKNVKKILASATAITTRVPGEKLNHSHNSADEALRHSVRAALNILDS